MVSASGEASSRGGGVKAVKCKLGIGMAKSFMARCYNRPDLKSRRIKSRKNPSSTTTATTTPQICAGETAEIADPLSSATTITAAEIAGPLPRGSTVNIADLLFTPERDFLVKNTDQKVMVGDLEGKAIVLYIAPLYERSVMPRQNLDMIQSYYELLPLGSVEFVFVPTYASQSKYDKVTRPIQVEGEGEAVFKHLFSTLPFPAVPFSDAQSCGDRLVKTFSVQTHLPYLVVIDHTGTLVEKSGVWPDPSIFKLFGGAELHPLSAQRILALEDEFYSSAGSIRLESRERLINQWDQILASPTRDFLLSSIGDQVPISSLKGKVIGLYFCDNVPLPPRLRRIKKVYEEAKSRGYDFEIVQINFHYHFINSAVPATQDMSKQLCGEDVGWLTLPFKDPSCKKLQRIFFCDSEVDDFWPGDCLVILDPRKAGDVLYEFSGAEIMSEYGVEGYPFTRGSLCQLEMARQKEKAKLHLLFPPGEGHFTRPAGEGCVDYSQLAGKRVLVLLGKECGSCAFVSMLKSKYRQQLHNGDKFEVVFVSIEDDQSRFNECIKGMPWLVHPFSKAFGRRCLWTIFRRFWELGAAAFDMDGELIAKRCYLVSHWSKVDAPFPFFGGPNLETVISCEVEARCQLDKYHGDSV